MTHIYIEECEACGRKVPRTKLKYVEEQFKGEKISYGTPGLVENSYKLVLLCSRCRFLRKLSIVLGIVVGFMYLMVWTLFYEQFKPGAIVTIIWALLNPLVFGVFFIMIFRVLTKCDTLIKTDFHSR